MGGSPMRSRMRSRRPSTLVGSSVSNITPAPFSSRRMTMQCQTWVRPSGASSGLTISRTLEFSERPETGNSRYNPLRLTSRTRPRARYPGAPDRVCTSAVMPIALRRPSRSSIGHTPSAAHSATACSCLSLGCSTCVWPRLAGDAEPSALSPAHIGRPLLAAVKCDRRRMACATLGVDSRPIWRPIW